MPLLYRGQTAKYVIHIASIAFVLAGILGIMHLATIGPGNEIGNCPFLAGAVVCNGSPLDHMSAYQQTFTSLAEVFAATLLLLLVLTVSRMLGLQKLKFVLPVAHYFRDRLFIFDALQEAFSRGILNAKVY